MPDLIAVVPPAAPSADGPKYDMDKAILDADPEKVVETEEPEESEEEAEEEETPGEATEEKDEEEEESEEEEPEPPKIPFSRPSIKDIKAKYPDFFKEFPDVKEAIFREARFTQLFPTVEDAKESFEDVATFNVLSDAALAGDSAPLLQSLAKTDEKALKAFSASFLSNLYKQDQDSYNTAVTPIFENFFRQAYKSGDDNLKNSALNLAQFLFGDDGEDSVLGKKTVSKVAKILEDSAKAVKDKEDGLTAAFRSTAKYVSDKASENMHALVLKDFDPDKVFTKTVREMLVSDIVTKIDGKLNQDAAHKTVMGAAWRRARNNGYNDDEKSKLLSTYLARAKSLIPTVREQVRSAALGKSIKSADKKREAVSRTPPKEVNGGGYSRSSSKGTRDYSKMSDLEILGA